MSNLNEAIVEDAALEWFGELGYAIGHGPHIAPGEPAAERDSFGEVVLVGRLLEAIMLLNPAIPDEACEDALRKVRAKHNLVQSQLFSEKLKKTLNAYHNRAIATQEVIEELIKLAKEMDAASKRGVDMGLTDDEVAFYDALAANDSAVQAMGDDKLKVIAAELITQVRKSVTIDWTLRESARAKIRVMVKRILNKYGYPPDLQEDAVKLVLQQAELLSAEWAEG
jgi:type I site-specific restriction-modification system R (restriction) subunit